jgi:ADP-ribosylglycohydrolase
MKKITPCLLGAVAGDIIGSAYEWDPVDTLDFPLFGPKTKFTDDTVLTVAVADHFVTGMPYAEAIHRHGNDYPHRGYGGNFHRWLQSPEKQPYNSFGNGSAMRVSPVGWVHNTLEETIAEAAASAAVTHNHPEGIKGAQATALAIFLARQGSTKAEIRAAVEQLACYNLQRTLAEIRVDYVWSETCQGSVPESIIAFLESNDFESAIRGAIWLRGDADTMAAIAGSIAEAFYGGVPEEIALELPSYLDPRLLKTLTKFGAKYMGYLKAPEG